MNWILGTALHPDDRRHVLAQFVHRMTFEMQARFPDFAIRMKRDGYRMPDRTDAEWLANTRFAVKKNGRLDARFSRCETSHGEVSR